MAIEPGLLIQPYASVTWEGTNLSAYPGASGEKERLVQNLSLSYTKDQTVPSCSFELAPTVDTFAFVAEMRQSPALATGVFEVEIGFSHLPDNKLVGKYVYAGLDMQTGHDPQVSITVTSAMKSSWTQNKVSFTMEEAIPLSEYPTFLQEKAGKGASLMKFEFVGKAKEDAAGIMIKANRVNQTPQTILAETVKEHGMELRTPDTAIDGTVVIGYPAAKKGELEQDKPQAPGSKAQSALRTIHIIGPGLMQNVKRTQKLPDAQSDTKGGTAAKKTAGTEVDNKNSPLKPTRGVGQQASAESVNPAGSTGVADKSDAKSETEKNKKGEADKGKAAITDSLAVSFSASFPMLPQIVGMKPGDIGVIPSLKGPGDFLEDFEITDVTYKMDNTGWVTVDIKGNRPYLGKENMLDAASIALVKGMVAPLQTPDAWNRFYWRMGPEIAWPLAG